MTSRQLQSYKYAAELLKLAKEEGKNVKQLLYTEKKYQHLSIKALYALAAEALKRWEIINILIEKSNILTHETGLNIWLLRIVITEFIFGKKELDSKFLICRTLIAYKDEFKKIMSKKRVQKLLKPDCESNLVKVLFVKVNTIKTSVESLIKTFVEEDWHQLQTADSYQGYLDQLRSLEPRSDQFLQDFHFPEVLVFPPGTELYNHPLYKNACFYFMDKSSCVATHVLRPRSGAAVLDMCAAPGLKTTILAAMAHPGRVYAVEKDEQRFKALTDITRRSGADNVVPILSDVTHLDPQRFASVEYILLDPTCSGSGIRDRQPLGGPANAERLHKLQSFQLTLLRFALTRFPAVKRVVYSTCSLNQEENEEVVEAALNSKYHNFKLSSAGKYLPDWINFGSQEFQFGSKCVYCRSETDHTNGFFVAVFKRRKQVRVDDNGNGKYKTIHPPTLKKSIGVVGNTFSRKLSNTLGKKSKNDDFFEGESQEMVCDKDIRNKTKSNRKRERTLSGTSDKNNMVTSHKKFKVESDPGTLGNECKMTMNITPSVDAVRKSKITQIPKLASVSLRKRQRQNKLKFKMGKKVPNKIKEKDKKQEKKLDTLNNKSCHSHVKMTVDNFDKSYETGKSSKLAGFQKLSKSKIRQIRSKKLRLSNSLNTDEGKTKTILPLSLSKTYGGESNHMLPNSVTRAPEVQVNNKAKVKKLPNYKNIEEIQSALINDIPDKTITRGTLSESVRGTNIKHVSSDPSSFKHKIKKKKRCRENSNVEDEFGNEGATVNKKKRKKKKNGEDKHLEDPPCNELASDSKKSDEKRGVGERNVEDPACHVNDLRVKKKQKKSHNKNENVKDKKKAKKTHKEYVNNEVVPNNDSVSRHKKKRKVTYFS